MRCSIGVFGSKKALLFGMVLWAWLSALRRVVAIFAYPALFLKSASALPLTNDAVFQFCFWWCPEHLAVLGYLLVVVAIASQQSPSPSMFALVAASSVGYAVSIIALWFQLGALMGEEALAPPVIYGSFFAYFVSILLFGAALSVIGVFFLRSVAPVLLLGSVAATIAIFCLCALAVLETNTGMRMAHVAHIYLPSPGLYSLIIVTALTLLFLIVSVRAFNARCRKRLSDTALLCLSLGSFLAVQLIWAIPVPPRLVYRLSQSTQHSRWFVSPLGHLFFMFGDLILLGLIAFRHHGTSTMRNKSRPA